MSYFYRLLKAAVQDFRRNVWLSLVTVSILVLTLLSINILVVFNAMTETAIAVIKDKVDISLYFKPGANQADIDQLKNYLTTLPEVTNLNYLSREEVLADFKNNHRDEETILSALDELNDNPLGAIVRVKARDLEGYPRILQALDQPEYNQLITSKDYDDRQEMIGAVAGWTKTGERVALIFILFFVAISVLIVFNAIRVAIYTHREEIGIEKLVGATNWFVVLPFIISSAFYGLISCVLTMAIIYPLISLIQPYISQFFGPEQLSITAYFNQHFVVIFGLQLLAISGLSVAASALAVRKYLRV